MIYAEGEAYHEEHRLKYATLLGRIVKARELSDEERAPHEQLYQRLLRDCASERVKATSPWIDVVSDAPVAWDDPRLAQADSSFGTVESVAIDIVDTLMALRLAESPEELMAAMGAALVRDSSKTALTGDCEHDFKRGVCVACGINKKQLDYERTGR